MQRDADRRTAVVEAHSEHPMPKVAQLDDARSKLLGPRLLRRARRYRRWRRGWIWT
jgi:hypothetical protein